MEDEAFIPNYLFYPLEVGFGEQQAWIIYEYLPGGSKGLGEYINIGVGRGDNRAQALADCLMRREKVSHE